MKVTGKKTLEFSKTAWDKMWGMTLRCKGEVSGLGIVDEHDPNKVIDFFIVEHVCAAASTEMDQEAVANLIADMRDKGVSPSRWRVWWHSHAAMKAFFSGTDEDNVERYASERALWSVVTNHEDARRVAAGQAPTEMYIRVDLFDPDQPKNTNSPMRYTIEGCDWKVSPFSLVADEWFEESMKKVGEPPIVKLDIKPQQTQQTHQGGKPVQVTYGSGGGRSYGSFPWQNGVRNNYGGYGGYGGASWADEYWWDWDGQEKAKEAAESVTISDDKSKKTDTIAHFAIQEFLDMDLLEIDAAQVLSHEYSTGEITDVRVHNSLVDVWNKYLETQRTLPDFKKTAEHQRSLNVLYEKVSDVLDLFELDVEEKQKDGGAVAAK